MRILLINGSPRGHKSSTLLVSRAFVEGLKQGPDDMVEEITLSQKKISDCRGCFTCWYKTPGKCVIHDDMTTLFTENFLPADMVIWSFPLYFYAMPAQIKAFMDRIFLNACPDITVVNGLPAHPNRVDVSGMKHVAISTCGFYSADKLYDAVLAQFRLAFGAAFAGHVFCAQGGTVSNRPDSPQVTAYLADVKKAGQELATRGQIAPETAAALSRSIFPPELYRAFANCIPGVTYALDHSDEAALLRSQGLQCSPV